MSKSPKNLLLLSVATLATKLAWTTEAAASETRLLDPAKIRAKFRRSPTCWSGATRVPVDETARAAKLLANGRLTVLPDTPHPFEQVEVQLLADQLHAFIG